MRYVGLDVHKHVVQAQFCDEQGRELQSVRFDLTTASLSQFAHEHLGPDCAVALEATTNTWAVVDILKPSCGKVVVSNPLKTKAIALSKHKSDRVDACMLAQLLRWGFLPDVWIPDADTRAARSLAERRSSLVRHGTWVKNRIQSLLHERLIQTPFDPFTLRGRQWLQELSLPVRDRGELETLLRILDAVAQEQAKLAELINADAYGRDGVKLLMTLPGVGAVIAQAMMAAIGDVRRFENPLKLACYFGLVPSVHQSAERAYHGKITKQGNGNVRWLLVEAAHHAGRHPGPLGHQFQRIARKKEVNVARVAIARKLAVLAWHLLTKGEPYRYASPVATEKKLADLSTCCIRPISATAVATGVRVPGYENLWPPCSPRNPCLRHLLRQRPKRVSSLPSARRPFWSTSGTSSVSKYRTRSAAQVIRRTPLQRLGRERSLR